MNGGSTSPKKSYAHILVPVICESYLIWKKCLCRCNQVKDFEMKRVSWIIQVTYIQWQVSSKERQRKMTEEKEAMRPGRQRLAWHKHKPRNVWSHQRLEGGNKSSPRVLWGSMALPDLGSLASRVISELIALMVLSHWVHGNSSQKPQERRTIHLTEGSRW